MAGKGVPAPAAKAGSRKDAASAERNSLKARLARLGLHRPIDCALHLPLRYEDETVIVPVAEAPAGEVTQVEVVIDDVHVQFRPRRQLVVRCHDDSAPLVLRFLNFYGSQTKQFESARDLARRVRLFGEVRAGFFGDEMVHPRVRVVAATGDSSALPDRLTPVYPTTAGLSQVALRKIICKALTEVDLSPTLQDEGGAEWPPVDRAVRTLHAPPPDVDVEALQDHSHPCWQRLKFEELVAQQLSLKRAYRARREKGAPPLLPTGEISNALVASLPFSLTGAQQRVWQELRMDLVTPHPMQRLLQGDVGSGKTVVAALAACQAIEAGYQAAFMAPTEILAEQHYRKLAGWLAPLGISVLWLSGSLRASEKKLRQAEAARAQLIVGTHALIQDAVDYSRLGIAIVDEQHRFGVAQRLALRKKGTATGAWPHQLMMSATPIPRTLAMTYFADLDVSVLDELPPGRTPVRTRLVSDARRAEVIERIRVACADGRQVYWVCPLIEESEAVDLQPAIDTHARLTEALPECRVGLVHGRLKSGEKARAMEAFVAGRTQVLVATTVIEVGVDVPNASLMVIEHAERFGLSQLHQLRGRVGRGTAESVCILIYANPLSPLARERLKIIYENTDGFEIARADLHLRGPGEFIGHRQSGAALLRYADLERDADLVDRARRLAEQMLQDSPGGVERHLQRWLGGREELLKA